MKNFFYYKLKNHMEIIFEKIKNVNVVSVFFVIKVGSSAEQKGKEGISHFLEHIVFKGTEKLSANDITEKIESFGGSINGYTSLDETAFYISIPKRNWKKGFAILREMIFNVNFREFEIENERKVIIEELKGGKDNPFKLLIDETFSTIFKNHPYKNPVIGYRKSIENISLKDLKDFYNKYYSPQNILLTIVGNLSEKEVKEELHCLEKLENKSKLPKNSKFNEPVQNNIQLKIVESNVNQFYLNSVFKIQVKTPKEFIGIQLLSSLLGEFEHSFLRERIKNKLQLVTDIGSFIYFTKNYMIFNIHCQFPKDNNPENIIKTLINELNNFSQEVILPDQLLKSKINFKSDKIFMRESVNGEAKNIIFHQIITGSFKNEERFDKAVDEITEKDIKNLFNKFFNITYFYST